MNASLPPPRYRVVEKGRRLVTVDTHTGEMIGLSATLPLHGLEQGTLRLAPQQPAAIDLRPVAVEATDVQSGDGRRVAPLPSVPITQMRDKLAERPGDARIKPEALKLNPANKNKAIALLIAASIALIFLVTTGFWVIPVALMIVPQTRKAILPRLSSALKRYFGQAANG